MIIIFVGCDCTGKSTCAERIGWRVEKGTVNSDFRTTVKMLKQEIKSGEDVIHDRIPLIDDFVYTKVFANRDSSYISCKGEVSELLKKCVVVYFNCDNTVLAARMNARGDKYITLDQIPVIKREYKRAFDTLNITPFIIDTTNKNEQEIFEDVKEIIAKCQE